MYSTYQVSLGITKPIWWFKDGALREYAYTQQGSPYVLPTASSNSLGGIKVGTNLSIDNNGVLSATDTTYTFATGSANGNISVNGTDVAVKGLKSAAYTESSAYATSSHSHAAGDITSGSLAVARGGTGKTSGVDACNYFLNELTTGSSTPQDDDYYISQYAGGGTSTKTYHRRPMSALYSYVKGKTDNVYLPFTGGTLTGNLTISKSAPAYISRHSNVSRPTTPSSNISWMPLVVEDKDGNNVGGVYNILYSTGVTGTALIDYDKNGNYHYMGMFHDSSGNPYGYCPTPLAASNGDTIATTSWVRTYATPANIGASTTDENVKSTATSPSSATDYYPIASSSSSTNTSTTIKNAAFNVNLQNGTASTEGYAKLRLGNTTATGTAGNMTGRLTLYNDKGKSTTLDAHVGDTTNRNTYLPKASGTLVCHTTDTAIGSTSKPVYVNENGFVTECGSSLTDYLPLSGGELSGNAVRVSAGVTPGFIVKSTNLTKGTAPGSVAGAYSFFWRDGADANIGGLYRQISTANLSELRIYNNWTASEYVSLGMTSANACDFSPGTDNAVTLGKSGKRWKQLIAGTTTISTSDERLKRSIKAIPDKVLDAWGDVQWVQFQFKDSYKEKGKQARLHTGAIAQRIKAVFEEHGIDPFKYGLLCYDSWDADDDFKAGDCYSLRYEEALCMEAAYQRRRADRLESRIEALEKAVKG